MGIDRDKNLLQAATDLRRHAEERLRAKKTNLPPQRIRESSQRLVHELEVHQVELEMQNAELGLARDVVEEALEKYSDLYDFAPVGYFTIDSSGAIAAVNLSGAKLFGSERSRLLGQNFDRFVSAAARPAFSEFIGKLFTSQDKESCEMELRANGNTPLFVQIDALACSSGQACQVAVIDITARKRVEDEHRQSCQRLAWILEKTCVGTWFNELPLGRLNWDAQTRELYFIAPGVEASIDLFWSRVHPDDRETTRQALESAIGNQSLYQIDHRVVDPASGAIRWIHSAGHASYAADGTLFRLDGISYDISLRKQNERLIQEYIEDLRAGNEELNRFNSASVGRELRMIELKKEINELYTRSGQAARYPLDFEQEKPA